MSTFDLNRVLSKPQLYTPIDYGNLNISTDSVQKAMNGVKDTIHALGYKTIEDKEAEQAALSERLYATQKQIQDLGLSEADSPRDFYAVGATPEQLQEWDRGSKLATGVGLGLLSLPYTVAYLPEMASTIKWGLSTPMGRKALLKTAASVAADEAIFQGIEGAKYRLNNSQIGDTKLNQSFLQPALTAMAIGVDPDSILSKNLAKGAVNDVARDMLGAGASRARMTAGEYSKKFADSKASGLYNHQLLIDTFGPEFMEEAFPFLPEYARGLDPAVEKMAKEAYLSELISGAAFKANGRAIRPSGAEITRRGIGKKLGYGNDGLIWLRGAPKTHLENPLRHTYSIMAEPGAVDKYLIKDSGSQVTGLFNEQDAQKYVILLEKRKQAHSDAIAALNKAIASKDRSAAIEAYRDVIKYESMLPSRVQEWNIGKIIKPGDANYDELATIGSEYLRRINSPGDFPLQYGLEFTAGDRIAEPLLTRDAADILYLPDFQHIDRHSKQEAEQWLKELLQTEDYKQIGDIFGPRLKNWVQEEIAKGNKGTVYQDIIAELMSPENGNLATILRAYAPDSTKGVGRVPVQVVTEDGFSKGIGAAASGAFNPSEKSILMKYGGILKGINNNSMKLLNIQ